MKFCSHLSFLLAVSFVVAISCNVRADDLRDTYRVRVVVLTKKHRLLTEAFREQVARELRDGIKSALGDLVQVRETADHPQRAEIESKGLSRALDGLRERSPERTYFVTVEFTGTHYRLETRMHDGLTGLPSPVVRHGSVRDTNRAYVSRMALFLLERDLGLLGTVLDEPDKQRMVSVALRGGGLGIDLGKWVKKGEILGLASVDGAAPGTQVPWAILRVVEPPRDGVCRCQLFSRYVLRQVTGLRTVLLGTMSGPLRLRLLKEGPNRELSPLPTGFTVQIRRDGFEGEDSTLLTEFPSRGRDVDTSRQREKGTFDKVAFVRVLFGEATRARLPVPILDDRLVVAGVPAGDEAEDLITFNFRRLEGNVADAARVQANMFGDINKLIAAPEQRAEAIQRVKETLQRSRNDYTRLTTERDDMRRLLEKMPEKKRPTLTGVNARMAELKSREADLLKTIEALERIEKDENDEDKKEWLLQKEKAALLEKEGKIEEAIDIYAKAPAKFQTDEMKKHLSSLRKLWDPVNDEHKAARKFLLGEFPQLATSELKEGVARALKSLAVCKKAGDIIAPVRLRQSTLAHVKRLDEEAGKLNPEINVDDEKPLKEIQELTPELRKLIEEIAEFLDKKKG